jgi:hypothetical protein
MVSLPSLGRLASSRTGGLEERAVFRKGRKRVVILGLR